MRLIFGSGSSLASARLCALAVAGVTALVFQSAAGGEFLAWDDDINITQNERLRALTWDHVRWMFSDFDYMRRYVPLTWLGWSVEHALFGLTARSAHIGNILLHALNAALVFWIARWILLRRPADAARGASGRVVLFAAAAGALFWALHPLRVEVVAWASGRIYCQAICLLLLATLAYFRAAEADGRARTAWHAASLVAFAASLLTYPLGLGYVVVLLVIDVVVLQRAGGRWWRSADAATRAMWREKLPYIGVTAAVLAVSLWARFQARGLWAPPPTLDELGVAARVMRGFYVWAYYGWKPFAPADLAPVYTTLVWFKPFAVEFVASAVGVVGVTLLVWWRRAVWPGVFGLWVCHLVLLVPMLGFTEHPHYANDRYSYLQAIPWTVGVAAAFSLLVGWRRVMALAPPLALGACVALTRAQIPIWRGSESLFRHLERHVGDTPYRGDIVLRLGEIARGEGRLVEAASHYEEALRLSPTLRTARTAHFGLALIARERGDVAEAETRLHAALAVAPDFAEASIVLGELKLAQGKPAQAAEWLQRGIDAGFSRWEAHLTLARAWQAAGQSERAVSAARRGLALQPDSRAARALLSELQQASPRPRVE